MMYSALHCLLLVAYVALPIISMARAFGVRRSRRRRIAGLLMTVAGGAIAGVSFVTVHGMLVGERAGVGQTLLAVYFATAVLMLLKLFDTLWRRVVEIVWRSARKRLFTGNHRITKFAGVLLDASFAFLRVGVLFAVVVPYLIACVAVYRPRVGAGAEALSGAFQTVSLKSADGTRLAGYWMAAKGKPSARTAIVCHGAGPGAITELSLARTLVDGGYNVFLFDFRAHGGSGGNLTTFGDLERADVLGAVAFVRANHAKKSRHVFGVGEDFGAAALLGAAASNSAEGQAIEAVALSGAFDDFRSVAHSLGQAAFLSPLDKIVVDIGLPIASAQTGTDLVHYRPADVAAEIWPRPVLLLHDETDQLVPFANGSKLSELTPIPKRHLWFDSLRRQKRRGVQHSAFDDAGVGEAVRQFFDRAKDVPVI